MPTKVIKVRHVPQPKLPFIWEYYEDEDGRTRRRRFYWPKVTLEWWDMWASSPLAKDFTQTDWAFLMDTAMVHARFWKGDRSAASELRLRVAKFGATPEDRARLRIVFAVADELDQAEQQERPEGAPSGARERARKRLKVVGGEEPGEAVE